MKSTRSQHKSTAGINHVIDKYRYLELEWISNWLNAENVSKQTLSLTSPTRISICSGADRDLPFRFRWIKANSTPSLSATAVTLVIMISVYQYQNGGGEKKQQQQQQQQQQSLTA